MKNMENMERQIRRLGHDDVEKIRSLMTDVISRLPSQALFAMDEEEYLYEHIGDKGEIYGAFLDGRLVAYTVLKFADNLGREFGVPEEELPFVAVLDSTVVHECARGRGLQRYFHQLREQRARERHCLYLYATVHPDNRPSINNLEAAGLTRQFTRPMYGGKLRHCYAKRLTD
ncbi:Acetyltransferase (GNAT) family protein [Paenibacillus konkukensis]|uniref:Acetyltransferase (GNAT) family protein n=1 Tax=Paenibacillus konkukensis TaxID=2020716 RepID=A0ABY4RHE5_9BACL|nr:GNAT family N-acetyltransferase [Paenibacillus konkukensis]UQZ81563.1 Acetyltransferase (GNAT) family protein [Paenibacillus konkukensis]